MKPILAIETSCDECAAAVVTRSGPYVDVLSNVVFSQIELHRPFGGIVPEVASRNHLEMVNPVMAEALAKAGITAKDLGAVAVTARPGLIGALLVGVSAAKALAYALNLPLLAVDHLEGHLHSLFINGQKSCPPPGVQHLPLLICMVSGGHTCLYLLRSLPPEALSAEKLAESRDDAAGEAFDKSAKLMGLPYPGGRYIDELARNGNAKAFAFPRPLKGRSLDFSFSGLKTAVSLQVKKLGHTPHVFGDIVASRSPQGQELADLCASLQEAIVDTLIDRIQMAAKFHGAQAVAIVGGVSANSRFRQRLTETVSTPLFFPSPDYCTDNAAMIGAAGVFMLERGEALTGSSLLKLNASSATGI